MKTMEKRDMLELVQAGGPLRATLYMPMYTGAESRQNPVRYKNLLRRAEKALTGQGVEPAEAEQIVKEAGRLIDEPDAWKATAPGLLACVSSDSTRVWRLPFRCDERCIVGKHYYVVPLIEWFAYNASFYVLAVSQNVVQLLHGTRGELEAVAAPKLPKSLREALSYDPREPALQAHSAGRQLPGKEGMVFHGQGGERDAAGIELVAFCREINRALADELRGATDPLVFVGVDYLFPIFRDVTTYPHLLAESVAGNPDRMRADELAEAAWPLVEAAISDSSQRAVIAYWDNVARGKTTNRLEEVIVAAQQGAVETLFIDTAVERTGELDAETLAVTIDDEPRPGREDLVNLAALLVMRSGGAVEPVPAGNVPGGGLLAAVLRLPASEVLPAMSTNARRVRSPR